jgi:hypothetical protein
MSEMTRSYVLEDIFWSAGSVSKAIVTSNPRGGECLALVFDVAGLIIHPEYGFAAATPPSRWRNGGFNRTRDRGGSELDRLAVSGPLGRCRSNGRTGFDAPLKGCFDAEQV